MTLCHQDLGSDYDIQWFIDGGFGDPLKHNPEISRPLIINSCLTGMVPRKKDTPHVPVTAEEIIADAKECYDAGTSIVHLHARDQYENPTYRREAYRELVIEIRRQCPGIVINLTTSGRDFNEFEYRSQVLDLEGDAKPDMASLTVGSMNFPKQASVNSPEMIVALAEKMNANGIKPELEIFETGMINYTLYLLKKNILVEPLYFNLLLGSLGSMPARLKDLAHLLDTLPASCSWGATGIGQFQLPINLAAIIQGGHVRVGLEDNIYYDSARTKLATNSQLVERLANFARFIGRKIATPDETRQMIGLSAKQQSL
ncbi:MAG: 3-keto-5-aminohexanoate cleavage protein [Patescibacteria group bacterium]